jgi:hypothetical protein
VAPVAEDFHVIDEDMLYKEIGQIWQFFASWREKLFAGYLSAIAALAFAFSKSSSIPVRAGFFAFGIVVSAVFRMLDLRTTDFINFCELKAGKLAGRKGFFGEFNRRRFAKTNRPCFGGGFATAINILVASILGACVTGLYFYLRLWCQNRSEVSLCWAIVVSALGVAFYLCLWWVSYEQFSRAKRRYQKSRPSGDVSAKT